MKISTRGRYALRVMIDLAQNESEKYISLKDISERQQISMKYLEKIGFSKDDIAYMMENTPEKFIELLKLSSNPTISFKQCNLLMEKLLSM